MLFAFFLAAASLIDWVPMRWKSADPATLDLLDGTPVNCILVERTHWSPKLAEAARAKGIVAAALLRPGDEPPANADTYVLEGDHKTTPPTDARILRLPTRANMQFSDVNLAGTSEGIWPGIQVDDAGSTKAAPSGAPWVNTNAGFLRFVRAAVGPEIPIWIAYQPPPNTIVTAERYIQAIADAAIVGARWILTFDDDWSKRFYARDAAALKEWKRITEVLAYFESHKAWRAMKPLSQLAIVQDVDSGALFSGGVLDMIAIKHTPILPVPASKLKPESMTGTKMALNVSPATLTPEQKAALASFTRSGGTMLNGPATWRFPAVEPGQITMTEADVKTLDEIWKEVNSMTGRRNLGARLFNVSSMLSNLLQSADGNPAALHLVNYSGYPVENITVHLLGKYKSATLLAPGKPAQKLETYPVEEGVGVDIPELATLGTLVLQ